jgi:GntR family transcriptional regulator of arabinose operon
MKSSASQRTADQIRQQFLYSQSAKVGDRLPRIQELARRYGVSVPTVSKALGLLQAEGLLETSKGAGTFIKNLPATPSGSVPQRARSIGFISNAFAPIVGQKVLAGVTRTAALHGCRVELAMTDWDQAEEKWHYQNMAKQGLDGVIVYPSVSASGQAHYLSEVLPDFPTVVIDLARPEMRRPSLIFDNWKAGVDMTQFLIDAGHERIAFINLGGSRSVEDRLLGYKRALANNNLPFDERLVVEGVPALASKNFEPLLEQLLNVSPRPTAIMAPSDQFAGFCLDSLEKLPGGSGQVVVTGFDNVQTNEWRHRFPTTAPDFYNLGERAVDMLLRVIDNPTSVFSETILPVPMVPYPATPRVEF